MNQFQSPVARVLIPILRVACGHPHPDQFQVREKIGQTLDMITVLPDMADLPILIGGGGRQVRAFKFLAKTAGRKLGKETELFLEESYRGNREKFVTKPYRDFNTVEFNVLLSDLAETLFHRVPDSDVFQQDDSLVVIYDLGTRPDADYMNIVTAMNDAFYPYGVRNGMKITIKPKGKFNTVFHERR